MKRRIRGVIKYAGLNDVFLRVYLLPRALVCYVLCAKQAVMVRYVLPYPIFLRRERIQGRSLSTSD
jgi:hypothetical protein